MTLNQAREEIEELILNPGPFNHNIVSLVLRVISEEYGYGAANNIVEILELSRIFGIEKSWSAIRLLKDEKLNHLDEFKYKELD